MDVGEVFHRIDLYYKSRDQSLLDLTVTNMTKMKMMIATRPSYPSNKLTFTIANLTKDRVIRYLDFVIQLNQQYDVDVILEDSKRWAFFNSS